MKQCYTLITLVCLFSQIVSSDIFSQVFWAEDFSTGIPDDWINDNNVVGPALWFHCEEPNTCPPNVYGPNGEDLGYGVFRSPTAANGYAYYDSFSWINAHEGILRTPNINISSYEKIFLEFYTHIATLNKNPEDNAKLNLITANDTITLKIFPGLWIPASNSANAYRVNLDLSEFLVGSDDLALEWFWEGTQEFSWSIDDITLSTEDQSLPPNTCWSERFAFGMEGWTTTNQSQPGAVWEWVEGGDLSLALFGGPGTVIQSPTGVDGAMVFNADYLTFENDQNNLSIFPRPDYLCELISPAIDLSCSEKPLELQFSQLVKKGNVSPEAPVSDQNRSLICSISWSTDNGNSWSIPVDASPFIFPRFSNADPVDQERTIIPLPPEITGIEEFRLKFTWAGDLFFWAIDDIVIADRPTYDMKVNQNFYAIMPNAMTPFGQVGEVGFLSDLTNIGCQQATGVVHNLAIHHEITGETIFTDQLTFPTVASDELVENRFFANHLNDNHIHRAGPFRGTYTVSQDSLDIRPENDSISWTFEISDSTFAKELGATRNISASESLNFTYGNCFFVPKGSGKYARWITVGISNITQLANAEAEINTFLYKWEDLNANDLAESDEYSLIQDTLGINSYQFNSMEDDHGYITIPVDFEGEGIPLEDSTYYIVAIQYFGTTTNTRCAFLASDQFNYQATTFASDSLNINRYASAFDLNNTGTFNFIGFGLGIVPVVRLHIGDIPDLSVPGIEPSAVVEPSVNGRLHLFPNPNNGQFKIDLELDFLSRYVGLQVINMSGSILFSEKFENLKEKQLNLTLPTIPPGTYLLKVQTDRQILTKAFVVQL